MFGISSCANHFVGSCRALHRNTVMNKDLLIRKTNDSLFENAGAGNVRQETLNKTTKQ